MQQEKIGQFLKTLRKEKNLTQEQLAEALGVSSRSVSRWERGENLPDLSLLVEIADFYDVDIDEIIDGERKGENMDEKFKESLTKVADYADTQKEELRQGMKRGTIGALIIVMFAMLLDITNGFGGLVAQRPMQNMMDFSFGLVTAVMIMNLLYLSGKLEGLRALKKRIFSGGKEKEE